MRCLVQAGLGSLLLSFIKSDVNKTSPISNEANSFNLQRIFSDLGHTAQISPTMMDQVSLSLPGKNWVRIFSI